MYALPSSSQGHHLLRIVLAGAGMRLQEAMEGPIADIAKQFCLPGDRHEPEEVSEALRAKLGGTISRILRAGGAPTLDYTCNHEKARDGCYRLAFGTEDRSGLGMVSSPTS
jgi:hypothetical protein